jgi:tetratricopeptide (TPR) repeat protein
VIGEDSADYSKPEDLLYRAYQESPDDPYVLVAYGQLLVGPGLDREESHTRKAVNKRRAGEFFEKAAAVAPHRWEFHLSHAGFLEIHGRDYDSALEAYQRAAQCNPAADEVHFRLGKLLQYHLRDFEGAEKAYQACLGVAPAHGEALAHYGLLLCDSLRHYSSARKVWFVAASLSHMQLAPCILAKMVFCVQNVCENATRAQHQCFVLFFRTFFAYRGRLHARSVIQRGLCRAAFEVSFARRCWREPWP